MSTLPPIESLSGSLYLAAEGGDNNSVQALLSPRVLSPTSINASILLAAKDGQEECLKTLLNAATEGGFSEEIDIDQALFWAVQNGHADCVQALLSSNNTPSPETITLTLIIAAKNGHADCIQVLLNFKNTLSEKAIGLALYWAVLNNKAGCVQALLSSKASKPSQKAINTTLIIAAQLSHTDCIQAFFNANAIKRPSLQGINHALVLAAHKGHEDCAQALFNTPAKTQLPLEEKINKDDEQQAADQALCWAADNGDENSLKALIGPTTAGQPSQKATHAAIHWATKNDHMTCANLCMAHIKKV